ncbi:STAS/SEC14 domain-containing protein [bacterium]|nr:STAS/SEC14 domain-containing protein [bacterium]
MAYDITFIAEHGIVNIKNSGNLSVDEIVCQTGEVVTLAKEKKSLAILTEFTAVIMNVSLIDVFKLTELYEQVGMDHHSKIAVLVSAADLNMEELQFYETVCFNRAWNIRIFTERDEAIEWLKPSA